MRRLFPQASLFIIIFLFAGLVNAQDRVLRILVVDLEGKPIPRIELSVRGASSTGITQDDGKANIVLAPLTAPNSEIKLYIVSAPKEYVFISPWEAQVRVPPFENATPNSIQVVMAEKGLRALLEDHRSLVAAAEAIKRANDWRLGKDILPKEKRVEALKTVAEAFGLDPKDLDQALRELEDKAKDPYEKGQSALYSKNYVEAEKYLRESAQIRKQQLHEAERKLADAEISIAYSLLEQEKYEEAVTLYRRAFNIDKDNMNALAGLVVCLTLSGRFEEVDPLYKPLLEWAARKERGNSELEGWYLLFQAINYWGQKRYKDTESILARIYVREIGDSETQELAAIVQTISYWVQGEYSKAEAVFPKTGGIDPWSYKSFSDALEFITKLLRLGDKEALAIYRGMLMTLDREKPEDVEGMEDFLDSYARLLRANGKKKDAETIEKRAKDFRTEQKKKSPKN